MNLFAYGTLMCADIMLHVAGCLPASVAARLKDYRRCRINGEEYPAVVGQKGLSVVGILYLDVPAEAWMRLDRFEGEMYVRQTVNLDCAGIPGMTADTYVINPAFASLLLEDDWSYEQFLGSGRRRFEECYTGFNVLT